MDESEQISGEAALFERLRRWREAHPNGTKAECLAAMRGQPLTDSEKDFLIDRELNEVFEEAASMRLSRNGYGDPTLNMMIGDKRLGDCTSDDLIKSAKEDERVAEALTAKLFTASGLLWNKIKGD